MKRIIAPIVELSLAVFLIAGAPFMWAFGPYGFMTLIFNWLPRNVRDSYWWEFAQERYYTTQHVRDGIALGMFIFGFMLLSGIWGEYPQYKRRVNTTVTLAFLLMCAFILYVIGEAGKRMGSF